MVMIGVAGVTLLRLVVLFASPIQLYPDEAQYWVWSRDLAWGYFSKPPMVAWLIALTTEIGGQAEPWVRLSSTLLHAGAALVLFDVGRRLYGARTGLLACVVYNLMPGLQLSCGVASTDAPLMFFLCAALWSYVRLIAGKPRRWSAAWGGWMGLCLGLAFLSKYAAVYFLVGLVMHALVSEAGRRAWRPRVLLAFSGALLLSVGPNLAWNARRGFVTFGHTIDNADWRATNFFHPGEAAAFVASQIGVFGAAPFVALTVGLLLAVRERWKGDWPKDADGLLLCLILPPIVAVSFQALVSRANANWAFAAYGPGSVLAAALLVRWSGRPWIRTWTTIGLGLQAFLAIVFLAGAAHPPLADRLGLANSLKRSRGWDETTRAVLDRAAREPGLAAIAVDNRFLYNEMRYYGRDRLQAPGMPPLRMWMRESRPRNHAEMTAPLAPGPGPVLAVSLTPQFGREFAADFAAVSSRPPLRVRLDAKHWRDAALFVGDDFAPQPRDQVTGSPRDPGTVSAASTQP